MTRAHFSARTRIFLCVVWPPLRMRDGTETTLGEETKAIDSS